MNLAGWWLLGLLAAAPGPGGGASPPGDTAGWSRLDSGPFRFLYPPGQQPLAAELAATADVRWPRILADLGSRGPERIRVVLCTGLACMERMAPPGARVPPWAAGMAFDRQDLVLLRTDQHTGRGQDLGQVFVHELAHMALSQAVGLRPLPRWFHEGFAIFQSGEWSLGRVTALASGVLAGRLFSLQALTDSFPDSPPDVELAYAQSIDFVAYLLREHGPARFRRLIRLLGRGWGFINAVEEAYDTNIFVLEDAWHADLKMRFTWLPLLTGTATLWGLATLVLLAAWLRKRRARAAGLERLAAGGDEDDQPPPPLTPTSP